MHHFPILTKRIKFLGLREDKKGESHKNVSQNAWSTHLTQTDMQEIEYIIELQTNSPTKKLSFATRYLVQINFTFDLSVLSNNFAGSSHFCVRIDEIEKLCNDLEKMHTTLSGSAKLSDNDSDGFVEFTISDNGHLRVCGQVGGSHEEHFVRFEFRTDQSCIQKFVEDFMKLLKYKDYGRTPHEL